MLRPDSFPDHLAERITDHSASAACVSGGRFVIYWMRTAVRAHENPALDVALTAGQRLGLPVFVYHALSEKYPYASDRHHTFILEGARDVEAECVARGIGYAFHLERPGQRGPALRTLAARAALVVTETMPVAPLDWLTDSLAEAATCPVWSVDTACVVPMPLVGTAHTRAFAFRDATAAVRAARVSADWTDVAPHTPAFVPDDLPYEPLRLAHADIAAMVARCEIDHGVAPVPHTRGGTVAGYARWRAFVTAGRLDRYAAKRNDASIDGVSRMSAYFHYGMVSTFRIVRECTERGGDGAVKYLDELLVWRELAYAFCYWHDAPDTLDAIPVWARETLARHESDTRTRHTWETLARSGTGDELWDTAQQSLRVHGELHNNVRMTWGKAIPMWSTNASESLERLIDLNHRYALDGRDPASYGGLLWCLGQFDRPFTPEVGVLGTVRPRRSDEHRQRMNFPAYRAHVSRSAGLSPRVTVIGAGISGLSCARTLHDHGIAVTVLDKSRGVGGRISTRREGQWMFDHGAPSLRLDDARLARYAESWIQDGVLQPMHEGEYVGARGMNTLPKHLARDLTVKTGVHVASIARAGAGWAITDREGAAHDCDIVLLATPAPQAAVLMSTIEQPVAFAQSLAGVSMLPCWSSMIVFDAPPPALVSESLVGGELRTDLPMLHRAWRQSSRRGRSTDEAWVVHSEGGWSADHIEAEPADIASWVSDALRTQLQIAGDITYAVSHRWRYARVQTGLDDACVFDESRGIGACGDWGAAGATRRSHPSVERAWLSGIALAGRVLGRATSRSRPVP
ncbi:FAD-dependent oxidoreductase [Gemmatimonas sp.]|uniref:FAD-dependent oxidoreductase n=1 Tax=Gemmatimonas sp. TaxID=1962908 RepID=UPI00286CA109|nr:FAD-dependent oxidoreductase [Gemmatimonas sp.]